MGKHVKTAAFATVAMAGILAVPAGAALNADKAPVAAAAQDQAQDLTTPEGIAAAIATSTPATIAAIVATAVANLPGEAASIVSQAAKAQPTMAAKIASAAVAAGADPATMVAVAATASGTPVSEIASTVSQDNPSVGSASDLASAASNVELADVGGSSTPTGSTTPGTQTSSNSPVGELGLTAGSGSGETGSGTGTESASTVAANNNGVGPDGEGPQASPT